MDLSGKLSPPAPTARDEICSCAPQRPIKLMQALSFNPLHCMNCNLEVRPETLALDDQLTDEIAHWNSIYEALYRLWLDSGEYEEWAAAELGNLRSSVNESGRLLVTQLNQVRECFYWWFQDESVENFSPCDACPACKGKLDLFESDKLRQYVCRECSMVFAG